VPQAIVPSPLATEPDPARVTVSAYCGGGAGPNVAVTPRVELMVTTQELVPEHASLHPVKTDPDAGLAVRLMELPEV
jgi:hypothetical protein